MEHASAQGADGFEGTKEMPCTKHAKRDWRPRQSMSADFL